jgi:hypothetical protein
VDDGTIAKAHRAGDASVDVGERGPRPCHVIGSSGVQDLAMRLRTTCGSRTGGWSLPCVMSD